MSQCHDIYSWDTYHGGHREAPKGAHCHDLSEPMPDPGSTEASAHAETTTTTAVDRELQPV